MITLYSDPELFGVADNNPFGFKAFAFLKLARVAKNGGNLQGRPGDAAAA